MPICLMPKTRDEVSAVIEHIAALQGKEAGSKR